MIGTKGGYAQHRSVSAGRVSQWITAGWLDEALVDGSGQRAARADRLARIDFDAADAALRTRLNIGQVMGQGRDIPPPPSAPPPAQPEIPVPISQPEAARAVAALAEADPAARIQIAKAMQAELETARQLNKAKEERGTYTLTSGARTAFARRLSDLVTSIDGWMPDLASRLSAHLTSGGATDRKALQILLRDEWRAFRSARAGAAAQAADALPPFIGEPVEEAAP